MIHFSRQKRFWGKQCEEWHLCRRRDNARLIVQANNVKSGTGVAASAKRS